MARIRKVKRRQKYRYSVNRKRLNTKDKRMNVISCKEIKDFWEHKKSLKKNLEEMGLAYDTNEALKIPKTSEAFNPKKKIANVLEVEIERPKLSVVKNLEEEAKAPRERKFRLPQNQVNQITYLLDKYRDDYHAMANDKKNYYQETWKQIRAKIKKFMSIPEQYEEYLKKKNET